MCSFMTVTEAILCDGISERLPVISEIYLCGERTSMMSKKFLKLRFNSLFNYAFQPLRLLSVEW
jgi:hypothetical protein